MESYCSLCTFKIPPGANNLILCTGTLDTIIHRLFFVTRLIINKINKVQCVDFKLENVLASLHSLKTMGLGSIIFKEWRVTWTFFYTSFIWLLMSFCDPSLRIMCKDSFKTNGMFIFKVSLLSGTMASL
jgi:hypothetical protein